MKNFILIFCVLVGLTVRAHDPSTLKFIFEHHSETELKDVGKLRLSFSMKESFSKEKIFPETLQEGIFQRAFLLSSKAMDFIPVYFRYEKDLWIADIEIVHKDIYWLWIEGKIKKLNEPFMTSIRLKIGENVKFSQIQTEVLKSQVQNYLAEFNKENLSIKISNQGKNLVASDSFWNEKWQIVTVNSTGSKLLHTEINLKKETSEIQVVFPHGFKGETSQRLWIYNAKEKPDVFSFKWEPAAKN